MPSQMNSAGQDAHLRRLWGVLGLVLLAVLAFLVLSDLAGRILVDDDDDPAEPVAGVTEVAVRDNRFSPEAIEVPAGTTVTWRWEGDNPHNVVGDGFESPLQEEGKFAHQFAEPGTYDYRCTLHPPMRGTVVVAEPSVS